MEYNIAIIGATGVVGRTLLRILKERNLLENNFYLYASHKSAGKKIKLGERYIVDRIMPDKAIDLIDEACSKIRISTHNDNDILKQYEDKLAEYNTKKEQLLIEDKLDEIKELKEKEALVKYEYEKEGALHGASFFQVYGAQVASAASGAV